MCLGQKDPLAPISAINPCTVLTGSSRPFKTDSSKLTMRLLVVVDAGALELIISPGDVSSSSGSFSNNALLIADTEVRLLSKSKLAPDFRRGAGLEVRGRPVF